MRIAKKYNVWIIYVAALLLTACSGADERAAKYLQHGKQLYAKGDYIKARLEFRNVLQINPKNVEGHYQYGLTEQKLRNWRSAFQQYLAVEQLDPTHVDAIIHLGTLFLVANDLEKAREKADAALALQKDNPDAHVLLGSVHLRQGKTEKAVRHAEAALAQDADNERAISLRVSLYLQDKQNEKAIGLLKESIKRHPKNTTLRMLQAITHASLDEYGLAASELNAIISLEPGVIGHRIRLARFYDKLNDKKKLGKTLRDTIIAFPENEEVKLLLAEFMFKSDRPDQAEQALLGFIIKSPDAYKLRFGLALYYVKANKPDKAKQVYEKIIKRDKEGLSGLRARTRLALMMIKEKNINKAETLIKEVLKEDPRGSEALLIRGSIALAKNDSDTAIADFRTVLQYDAGSLKALLLLARAQLQNKQMELARKNIMKAIGTNPRDRYSRMELADLSAKTGNLDGAIEQLQFILDAFPTDFSALKALATVQLAKKDWTAAEKTVNRIKKAMPDNVTGFQMMGVIYRFQKRFNESIIEFEQVLNKVPDAIEPLVAVIKNYYAIKQPQKALQRIEQVIARSSENYVAYNLKGEVLLMQKKYSGAETAFRKSITIRPDYINPYKNLASLFRFRGDKKARIHILQTGLAASKDNTLLLVLLVNAYEESGKYDEALAVYKKILGKLPENDMANNNLAMLLVDYKRDTESLVWASKLVKRFETTKNPIYADTLGWVFYKNGDMENALRVLQMANRQAPELDVLNYHLAMVYYKKGDRAAAKRYLQKAITDKSRYFGLKEAKETLDKL